MKFRIVFFCLFFAWLNVNAGGEQTLIAKGNKAYAVGAYTDAAATYEKVVAMGLESPDLYYNLGNAYFKMNDFAKAILWYERAQRLEPGNEDIDFNLKVANNKIADKIEPLPELFYKRWFTGLVHSFSVDAWAWMGIIFLVLALSAGALYLISRILFLRKAGFWIGLILLFFSIFSLFLAWSGNVFLKSDQEAIIFTPTITIKSSPDDKSTDLFVLHEGAKVQLLDNISGWYEIRIANGSVGWLPVTAVERI
ncbi:MAG: tetratricopeptide repeat protein [Bacteroidales bacterium]|nr:tetratricopeptide repeat protein [Bacteroidales bacterium]MDD4603629.1 tetratricopeptide repeat protein [Bacteroidales bacterium]